MRNAICLLLGKFIVVFRVIFAREYIINRESDRVNMIKCEQRWMAFTRSLSEII